MYTSEKKFDKLTLSLATAVTLGLSTVALSAADTAPVEVSKLPKNVDAAVIYPVKDGHYADYRVNMQVEQTKSFNHGRTPTANEIKAWNVDVRYDFQGLPEGKGTAEQGEELYSKHCEMCHGEFGAGGKGYPTLVGGQGTLKNQLINPENGDEPPIRTIGSYWPYASTLFWYIKEAMPFPHPKSLTNDEVYSIAAYLLSLNEIQIDGEDIDDDTVIDKKKFMKIVMPNVNGFYPKVNGDVGTKEMRKYLNNFENYGQGTRCMHNCTDDPIVHIKYGLNDGIKPPLNETRDLPKETGSSANSKEKKLYEEKCAMCHNNKATGAPVPGDKEAWADRIKQGKETLYDHAIHGFNGMPPKGGSMDLKDETVKSIVDYMVEQSK